MINSVHNSSHSCCRATLQKLTPANVFLAHVASIRWRRPAEVRADPLLLSNAIIANFVNLARTSKAAREIIFCLKVRGCTVCQQHHLGHMRRTDPSETTLFFPGRTELLRNQRFEQCPRQFDSTQVGGTSVAHLISCPPNAASELCAEFYRGISDVCEKKNTGSRR